MSAPQRNFLALATGEVGSRVLGFAATALLARRVGADGFGILGFALAVTSYLIVPGLSLQDVAAREVAKQPSAVARMASGVVRARVLLALLQIAVAYALVLLLPKPPATRAIVALSTIVLIPLSLNTSWAYKALERTTLVAQSLFLVQLVYLVGVALFVHTASDVGRVPVIQAAGEMAAALLLLPIARGGWVASSLREGLATLRGGALATISRYMRALTVTGDVVLVSILMSDRAVGLYSAAYRVCFLLTAIAVSAHVVFIAPLTRARDRLDEGNAVLGRSVRLAWLAVFPLVIGGMQVAPDLLAFMFGEEFREGATAFRLLLASIGVYALQGAVRNVFVVQDRMDTDARINGVAALLNIALNIVVIPRYGLTGAATVMVLTELLVLIATSVVLFQWGWRVPVIALRRPTVAVLPMCLALAVLPPSLHVAARIAMAGTVLLLTLWLLGELRLATSGIRANE